MSEQSYHWMEGDAHKVGRLALVDGVEVTAIRGDALRVLMQELHTNRLTWVNNAAMKKYYGDKTPAKQEART